MTVPRARVIRARPQPADFAEGDTVVAGQVGDRDTVIAVPLSSRARIGQTRVIRHQVIAAQREAEQLIQQTRERVAVDLAQKEEAARQRAAEILQAATAEAAIVRVNAQRQATEAVERALPELTGLAVRIAEKILAEQLRLTPESVVSIVRQVLCAAAPVGPLTLLVHPSDRQNPSAPRCRTRRGTRAESDRSAR